MDFNDTTLYEYKVRQYTNSFGMVGWKVYHIEKDEGEVMDMCFVHEKDAISYAKRANENEPRRVAEAKERNERFRRNLKPETLADYYGVPGRYYGD